MSNRYDHLDKSFTLVKTNNRSYRVHHRGPNGRGLCRKCGEEVPQGRRSYCSNECYEAWLMMTSSQYKRKAVYARDRGVCSGCGIDTNALKQAQPKQPSGPLSPDDYRHAMQAYRTARDAYWQDLRAKGFDAVSGHLWEADHILAVADGGGECDLNNYQTLCIPCHRKKTAELVARLAQERRR